MMEEQPILERAQYRAVRPEGVPMSETHKEQPEWFVPHWTVGIHTLEDVKAYRDKHYPGYVLEIERVVRYPWEPVDESDPDPTNPMDLRVPPFERVSDFSFDEVP